MAQDGKYRTKQEQVDDMTMKISVSALWGHEGSNQGIWSLA